MDFLRNSCNLSERDFGSNPSNFLRICRKVLLDPDLNRNIVTRIMDHQILLHCCVLHKVVIRILCGLLCRFRFLTSLCYRFRNRWNNPVMLRLKRRLRGIRYSLVVGNSFPNRTMETNANRVLFLRLLCTNSTLSLSRVCPFLQRVLFLLHFRF